MNHEDIIKEFLKPPLANYGFSTLLEEVELLQEKALTLAQMAKDPARLQHFIDKIKKGEPFETMQGRQVTIKPDSVLLDKFHEILNTGDYSLNKARELFGSAVVPLPLEDGAVISLGMIKKTSEFGAKDYLTREISAKTRLSVQIAQLLRQTSNKILTLRIAHGEEELVRYPDVAGVADVSKIYGTDAKADFQLIRANQQSPIFISHKHGDRPESFGQWSGCTLKAGKPIFLHREVRAFVDALKKELAHGYHTPDEHPRKVSFGRKIEDPKLKLLAIFGPDYNPIGPGSPNNVDLLIQGNIILVPFSEKGEQPVFTLQASHVSVRLPKVQIRFPKSYTPALITRFGRDRVNWGIRNLRLGIYPEASRPVRHWL